MQWGAFVFGGWGDFTKAIMEERKESLTSTAVGDWCIVHVRSWYDGLVGAKAESDVGKSGDAGEGIATLCAVIFGTGHFGVICGYYDSREEQESGPCVHYGSDGG